MVSLAALVVASVAAGFVVWPRVSATRLWEKDRPVPPASLGDSLPGLDARLAACAQKFQTWPPDPQALAEFAQACHANGQFEPALAGYRALMKLQPTEPRWPHFLATILAGQGLLDEALPALRRACLLAPDQLIVWLQLGDALLKSNITKDAAEAYTAALQHSPENPYALLGLARCDLQADRWTAARAHLQQAVAHQSDFSAAQSLLATVFDRLGNPESAAVARSRIGHDGHYPDPPDPWADALLDYCHDPYALLIAASSAAAEGNSQRALPILQRALKLAPNDPRLHRKLGNTLVEIGDLPQARTELERAVQLAPDNDAVQLNLVAVLRKSQDRPAVEQAVVRALATCPNSAGLHYEAGRLAEDAGRFEEAAEHFDFTWKNQPDQPAMALALANVRFRASQTESGVRVLEQLLQERPDYAPAAVMLVTRGIEIGDARTANWFRRASTSGLEPSALNELERSYQRRFGAMP